MCVCLLVPVVVRKAWPPVGRPEEGLEGTGQVHEQVTHQEEPEETENEYRDPSGGSRHHLSYCHTHVYSSVLHCKNGSDQVQRGDENPKFGYQRR